MTNDQRIPCQRDAFDIPDDVSYFRCAASGPMLNRSAVAGQRAMAQKSRPWTRVPGENGVETARSLFAGLIGAFADDIALTPSASYGLSTAAENIPVERGQSIVVLAEQFPSNVYPWRALASRTGAVIDTVARPADDDWTPQVLARITSATAIAALPQCHWTDGSMLDLVAIGERCRETGAALVVDASQSLGAVPFDVSAIRPDFVATVAEKWLLGPVQLGFLYAAPHRHCGRPLEHTWLTRTGSDDHEQLIRYVDDFQPGARRFDVGARGCYMTLPVAIAALEQITRWKIERIALSLSPVVDEIAVRSEAMGLKPTGSRARAPHMLGLRRPQGLPGGLVEALARDGVFVSVRGDAVRVAPHLYNDGRDVDQLMNALRRQLA